ncbi:MAG TPA: sigma-70 family RNA polymerase sigma factor [Candidatus Paceibacterota bacterium]|nr:sigma-70 family RNA polymerase sigma factor [Candidatus Paceibacterota bacterium]
MEMNADRLPTRATLLERVKASGDEASWREFHDLYRPLVLAVARSQGLEENDAQDVAQETFRALAQALPSYAYDPQRASFKAWLRVIISHQVANFYRRRDGRTQARARIMVRESPGTAVMEKVASPSLPVEDAFEGEWRRILVLHALAELKQIVSTRTYQVVYLLVHGKSPAEVAMALGVSRGCVYLARHRAEPRLRQLIRKLKAEYG